MPEEQKEEKKRKFAVAPERCGWIGGEAICLAISCPYWDTYEGCQFGKKIARSGSPK